MICPSCSQENRESARFCDGCGIDLLTPQEEEDTFPPPDVFASSEGFVGRRQELAELGSVLEDANAPSPVVV